jgi:soluble lytic murein transglycosylase
MVVAVELLLKLEESKLAAHVLSMIEDELDATEPSFRLYVAELSRRNGSMIQPFRILSTAFRDDPLLISHDTMQVFYPLKFYQSLAAHADKVDPFLIAALIRQESGFNVAARSRVGAVGLMQIMPATARRMARVSHRELMRPDVSIKLGIRYFRGLLDHFGGDAELALAAYNAGPKNVEGWIRRYPTANRLLFLDMIPFTETRNYVALIGRNFFWYQKLYQDQEKSAPSFKPTPDRATAAADGVFFKSSEFLR